MRVRMYATRMWDGVISMAVGVKMNRSIAMTMGVEMHAVTPQPPKHMRAETYHHDANRALERLRDMFRNRMPQDNGRAGEQESVMVWPSPHVSPCRTMSPTLVRRAAMLETAAI